MKFLFDLLPVILFFTTFKVAGAMPEQSLALAQSMIGSGVTALTAPVLLATVTAIAVTALQVAVLLAMRRKVEPMLWISLAVIAVFGGLTIYLRNEMFIKWKPTILYWIFGAILLYGNAAGKNFMRMLLSKAQIAMPDAAWAKLQNMWIAFFFGVGVINLAVAYACSTEIWVDFKLFGLLALTIVFTIAVGWFMTKNAEERQN
ncbi:MAG: Inner membrane-spanning protein YciB [Burkholderia sp.]|jgi:intracellular septation protein